MLSPRSLSLIVLVLQNTCLVLLMRLSRTRAGEMYLASVAVASDEFLKLLTCVLVLFYSFLTSNSSKGVSGFWHFFVSEVVSSPLDFLKMSVPAICYTVQKNFLYLAISNLDAAVFQVAYQGKILTTAGFAFILLRKEISRRQLYALFVLVAGVSLVQLSTLDKSSSTTAVDGNSTFTGLLAVGLACCTSGFAAVYFEYVLKSGSASSPNALWIRNFQLATFALIAAVIGVWAKDGEAVKAKGIFQGFDWLIWAVVGLEAFGGLVVALVIKYADTILKNFATAISILSSTIVSWWFLNFKIGSGFSIGAALVVSAVWLYNSGPKGDREIKKNAYEELKPIAVDIEAGEKARKRFEGAEPRVSPRNDI